MKVLLIEDDVHYIELLKHAMSTAGPISVTVQNAETMGAAVEYLRAHEYDAILVDLGLPDSQGLDSYLRVHQMATKTPIIIITNLEDEALALKAMENGAQDYLFKRYFDSESFMRSVRYATVRQDLRVQLEDTIDHFREELAGLESDNQAQDRSISARLVQAPKLFERDAGLYEALVVRYGMLLESAISRWIYKEEVDFSAELLQLAEALGDNEATPRDVIDVHTTALQRSVDAASPAAQQTYITEGRLLVLQLMGYLASYYRNSASTDVEAERGGGR